VPGSAAAALAPQRFAANAGCPRQFRDCPASRTASTAGSRADRRQRRGQRRPPTATHVSPGNAAPWPPRRLAPHPASHAMPATPTPARKSRRPRPHRAAIQG
jgi:hypothetical protein